MSSRTQGHTMTPVAPRPFGWLHAVIETIHEWRLRVRLRRHLSHFGDHLLDDIGLDRQAADEEVSKPFWRR